MSLSSPPRVYHHILRELTKAASPRPVNKTIRANFRNLFDRHRASGDNQIFLDAQKALSFLRAEREHKLLLERYNPLFDLTAEERIEATAQRVGLNMPKLHKPGSEETQ